MHYDAEQLACAVGLVGVELDAAHPWRRDALCREYPGVNFFPGRSERAEPARAICGRCLVQRECREYAEGRHLLGVWGATSGNDRTRRR